MQNLELIDQTHFVGLKCIPASPKKKAKADVNLYTSKLQARFAETHQFLFKGIKSSSHVDVEEGSWLHHVSYFNASPIHRTSMNLSLL
jgi:hypothetical protein